ncbi:MAG: DUF2095 family protein [Candidatus Helarchaeota archaeon]|nr:DUF2095 family protein [Candidatus Helarchaeota archaeon]
MTNESNPKSAKKKRIREKDKKINELAKEYLDSEKDFEDLFPNLAKEIEIGETKVSMTGIRWNTEKPKDSKDLDELKNPDIISFIRRCNCNEEVIEIIDYMLHKGEITSEYAEKLKIQLELEGLRSFGTEKKPGYYLRKYFFNDEDR